MELYGAKIEHNKGLVAWNSTSTHQCADHKMSEDVSSHNWDYRPSTKPVMKSNILFRERWCLVSLDKLRRGFYKAKWKMDRCEKHFKHYHLFYLVNILKQECQHSCVCQLFIFYFISLSSCLSLADRRIWHNLTIDMSSIALCRQLPKHGLRWEGGGSSTMCWFY